jgi:hypothetical protein
MKTEALIDFLAARTTPIEANVVARRFAVALGWSAFCTTLLMALVLGVRADLVSVLHLPMFWIKLALPLVVALASARAITRLARPGGRLTWAPFVGAAPIAAIWGLAVAVLVVAPAEVRVPLVMGSTWRFCLLAVPLLSLPPFVAIVWAVRGLAPTRLAHAGAATGLLAGSLAETIYALHCPEMAAPVLAVFYVGAMLIPAVVGFIAGPRLLRW